MWHYLWEWLAHCFYAVWKADEGPEARRFTLGCAAVVFVLIGGLIWCFERSR